ncbi:MAG: histidine kinase [Thermodesulfovibrio sp.]|nr:histidine kinase [Thermodesulfovibrio sp.]
MFRTGVVVGKFYPPHRGHHFLIETASAQCEILFVLVCWKPEQSVPIDIRVACIREVHPEVKVLAVEDILADDDTPGWAAYTVQLLGSAPDAVFTSEDYGEGYARAMGAKHVMLDRHRLTYPCSGTMLRNNPLEYLKWVTPCIRAFYVKRVCIVGAESTGKTTLAQKLAEHYQTNWVPEYGREYCVEKWKDGNITDVWVSEEFVAIAKEQGRREDHAARSANKVLICDTDPFATSIWHERYLNNRSIEVETIANNRRYDLYVLTGDEIPFVQDGLRDGEHIRHWMHKRFIAALTEKNRQWVLVTGEFSARISLAVRYIDEILEAPHP